MADEPNEVGISLKCSTNLFCSTCNALWPQYRFFNIVHLSPILRHVNCIFLNCFYTHLQLEMAVSVFILIFSHIFCLCMFLIEHGWSDMAYQMNCLSSTGGNFIDMVQKSLFAVCILLYPPKTFFQHHEFCRNYKPYDIYISLSLLYTFSCIDAYICLHFDIFTYFLSGNVWNRSWVKWYGIEDVAPYIYDYTLHSHFSSDGHPPMDLIWGQSDISITCLSNYSFYKVFHNDHTAQCGINYMCTVVSQKCNICQLHSYIT